MSICTITADFVPKWRDIRNADIMSNRKDICNNCGYKSLYEIPNPLKKPKHFNKIGE